MTSYLILIATLLALSALLSCFETSITAVSRAHIHRLSSNGNPRAKRLEKLLKKRESIVSVMLLANNAVNIAAAAITTKLVIDMFGEEWIALATIALTAFVIIFCEILPKTIAIKLSEKVAMFFAPTIDFLFIVFSPVMLVIQAPINLLFRSSRKSMAAELEEIRNTVDLKAKEGAIFKYDQDLLDGVLDLSDTNISKIMIHRKDIKSLDAALPTAEIVKQAVAASHTRIPLWRNNKENIVAILNVKNLLRALHVHKGDVGKLDLGSVTSQPWFVPASNKLRAQLFSFRKKKKRFALVVDEYSSLLGLITLEDILEEIVGEIKEQDDTSGTAIVKLKNNSYKIAGKNLIRDINKKLNWDIKESDDAYSLAAFIINNLGKVPEEKEKLLIDGYQFEILEKRGHDLVWIKCWKV
ncbi:MAG: DUF21 domain-containing protein [Alphaproteobacteria bacterium]|nr:DUF21 domain-containing protein [Alphaproteobacteria bacterium]